MSAVGSTTRPIYVNLAPGDPAPWFTQRSYGNPQYTFDTAAGRYIVLCFFGSAADPLGRQAIDSVIGNRAVFDDVRACFFGVSLDPRDQSERRVHDSMPGIRFFWDFDGAVSRIYGAIPKDAIPEAGPISVRRFWIVLDPTLRVMIVLPFPEKGSDHAALFKYLDGLPPPGCFAG